MTKSKPAPNDSSTIADEIIRPWTIDEALDKKIQGNIFIIIAINIYNNLFLIF